MPVLEAEGYSNMKQNHSMSYLSRYFQAVAEDKRCSAAIASWAALDALSESSPEVVRAIVQELLDQRGYVKLIASENYCSLPVQLAMGNWLTDKYSEGYPGRRFYAGCQNVDLVEGRAVELAKKLFGADHAYVQPHSGADANLVAIWAILLQKVQSKELERIGKKTLEELTAEEYEQVRQLLVNQKVMGMSLGSGGHLTHGYRHNISSKMMQSVSYEVDPETGLLDYQKLQEEVAREKPLILIAGYSSYSRLIDFCKMREIADSVGAVLWVDMAHFAGLVAGKVFQGPYDPIPYAHIVTTTTHKTLRGPRGGMVLCKEEFREAVNKGCPLVLGGPLPHVMAAKAVAFEEALSPQFQSYAQQVVENAKAFAAALTEKGCSVLTGGTDNHLLVVDVAKSFHLTGLQAEGVLREALLTVNRNSIPRDPNGAWFASGVRMGTPAVTSLGMQARHMEEIAQVFVDVLREARPERGEKGPSRKKAMVPPEVLKKAQEQMRDLLKRHPLYPELGEVV